MKRVCIVTPGALGSNPRVVKEADALSHHGYAVDVICTRTLQAVDERDADVMATARWKAHRVDLASRSLWRAHRLRQALAARAFAMTGFAPWADSGFSAFTPALKGKALTIPADLYIAHYPAALPAAAAAAARHGAAYAFDAEDFHPGDDPDEPRYDEARTLLRALDRRYLPGAAYISAASPGIADAYVSEYGLARPAVVLNTFPKGHAPEAPTARGEASPGPSIYWYSQTIGPDRGLECAVDAIALTVSRPHLYLRGLDLRGFAETLRRRARELGVENRLHILPPAAPSRMERLAAEYDAGFVGETGVTRNRKIALTNKQFSYLLAGIPVILSDTPGHRRFAQEAPGAAYLYRTEDRSSLAAAIDAVLGDQRVLAAARKTAFDLGQSRYNWEFEAAGLISIVDKTLKGAPSSRH